MVEKTSSLSRVRSCSNRIDFDLDLLSKAVGDLADAAKYYRDRPRERDDRGVEWSQSVAGLRALARSCAAGEMTDEQMRRYLRLLRELRAALPYLSEMDWEPPDEALFDALDGPAGCEVA